VLLSCASGVLAADEEPIELCRTPPKSIIADSKSEYHPTSTAMPPVGTVVLEFTVMTDGTILNVSAVEPVNRRLARWAIEQSKNLKFVPVSKACRTRFTFTSRITDAADGA
jgi:outer membrane biosynthesis protein TonB